MNQSAEIKSAGPAGAHIARPRVFVSGSFIMIRAENVMLKEPRPAEANPQR